MRAKIYCLAWRENFLIISGVKAPFPAPSSVERHSATSLWKFSLPFVSANLALLKTDFAQPQEYSIPLPAGWHFVERSTSTPRHSPKYIRLVFSPRKSAQSAKTVLYSTFSSKLGSSLLILATYVTCGSSNPLSHKVCLNPLGFPTHPPTISSSSTLIDHGLLVTYNKAHHLPLKISFFGCLQPLIMLQLWSKYQTVSNSG